MELRQFFEHLSGAQRVYGEPYEKDGTTIIPAVAIRAGGGYGSGSGKQEGSGGEGEGGGGGAMARPVGAYVIRDGKVSWEPAIDVNRIVFGGQVLCGLALIVFALRAGQARARRR
ncbi:hypothetical protein GCM10022226_19420 [Sphaerisporangium flaviroseum]|uniref:Sporulation protein n=1 Tax=Sphaerisporangium flaviroseum TaxID=509199 RepID=A0ABP7HN29_9ACTN